MILARRNRKDPIADVYRKLFARNDIADNRRSSYHKRSCADVFYRRFNNFKQVFPAHCAVCDNGDNQCVQSRDGARFGRRHNARVNTHKEDDGRKQRRKRFERKGDKFVQYDFISARIIALFCNDGDVYHEEYRKQYGGDHTAHKQSADRCAAEHCINNQRNRGREYRADRRRRCGDCAAEFVVETFLAHCLNFDFAQAGRIGYCRTGHAGKNKGGKNIYMTERTPHASAQAACEFKNHVGDLSRIHYVRRKDKKRNRDNNVIRVKRVHYLIHDKA